MKHLGTVAVLDLSNENRILANMRVRHREDASNRMINMELLCLSRAVNRTWGQLWPGVARLDEPSDVGRALSPGEEGRILGAAAKNKSLYILIARSFGASQPSTTMKALLGHMSQRMVERYSHFRSAGE